MCCIQILSKVMYTVEKLTVCLACLALLTCVISTLIFTLGFGVGLGYNYCFVDLKTYKEHNKGSWPKMRVRNDKPIYPYPPHRYPSTYYYPPGYSRPSTNPKTTITTVTPVLILRDLQANKRNLRIGDKDLKDGPHSNNEGKNKNITLDSEPRNLRNEHEPIADTQILGVKGNKTIILNSETNAPEYELRRKDKEELKSVHDTGEVIFDYNYKEDIAISPDRRSSINEYLKIPRNDFQSLNKPSKVYKKTSVNITSPDYISMYAPNYKPYYFKTSDDINKTGYYVIPDTMVKANEKLAANSSKDQTVIPVSKLDFLRILSKLSSDNKNYSLQVIF